jgi:hypothetical protein
MPTVRSTELEVGFIVVTFSNVSNEERATYYKPIQQLLVPTLLGTAGRWLAFEAFPDVHEDLRAQST